MAKKATAGKKLAVELHFIVQQLVVDFVLQVFDELVKQTPKDTGWAYSNWLIQMKEKHDFTVGSRDDVLREVQKFVASQFREQYKLGTGPIHIANNVPYIEDLNSGTSPQALAGYVQAIVLKTLDHFGFEYNADAHFKGVANLEEESISFVEF